MSFWVHLHVVWRIRSDCSFDIFLSFWSALNLCMTEGESANQNPRNVSRDHNKKWPTASLVHPSIKTVFLWAFLILNGSRSGYFCHIIHIYAWSLFLAIYQVLNIQICEDFWPNMWPVSTNIYRGNPHEWRHSVTWRIFWLAKCPPH